MMPIPYPSVSSPSLLKPSLQHTLEIYSLFSSAHVKLDCPGIQSLLSRFTASLFIHDYLMIRLVSFACGAELNVLRTVYERNGGNEWSEGSRWDVVLPPCTWKGVKWDEATGSHVA